MTQKKQKRSEIAADKRLQSNKERKAAAELSKTGDRTGAFFHGKKADQLEHEALELERPDKPPAIGTGTEVITQDSDITDLLVSDPDSAAVDASEHRLEKLKKLDIVAPALDAANSIKPRNSLERNLAHQMAACHSSAMDLIAQADEIRDPAIMVKVLNMAARFMDTYQRGMETLVKTRNAGKQLITVKQVHVTGGQNVITDKFEAGGGHDRG